MRFKATLYLDEVHRTDEPLIIQYLYYYVI